ncbi:hypothetical protein ACIA74_39560 [Streptomyces sp. NPDC051658]|nr:hypothetical protein OG520_38110 [Streptomyces sp. NBC_00984]
MSTRIIVPSWSGPLRAGRTEHGHWLVVRWTGEEFVVTKPGARPS